MSEQLFELADRLRALRDEKAEAEQRLKELNAAIDETEYQLSERMAESETQNFTRQGMMFCLTTKTRASATAGRKRNYSPPCAAKGTATSCMKRSTPTASPLLSRSRWRRTATRCPAGFPGW